jgi:hypothetical protein
MTASGTKQKIKSDFKNQIEFLKQERNLAIQSARAFEKDSLPYKVLMEKARLYVDIEQNMYALCAMATKMLR